MVTWWTSGGSHLEFEEIYKVCFLRPFFLTSAIDVELSVEPRSEVNAIKSWKVLKLAIDASITLQLLCILVYQNTYFDYFIFTLWYQNVYDCFINNND